MGGTHAPPAAAALNRAAPLAQVLQLGRHAGQVDLERAEELAEVSEQGRRGLRGGTGMGSGAAGGQGRLEAEEVGTHGDLALQRQVVVLLALDCERRSDWMGVSSATPLVCEAKGGGGAGTD